MARAPVDSGARLVFRQMGAILKKNALLKYADWRQTLAEVRWVAFLPYIPRLHADQALNTHNLGTFRLAHRGTGTTDLAEPWLHSVFKVLRREMEMRCVACRIGVGWDILPAPGEICTRDGDLLRSERHSLLVQYDKRQGGYLILSRLHVISLCLLKRNL